MMDILGPTNMNRGPSGPPPVYYLPLRNTAVDPTHGNWRTAVDNRYTFVPNDGIYLDDPFTTMYYMLYTNSTFNDPDIVLWDTSLVTTMFSALRSCPLLNQPIGVWDTSSVVSNGMQWMLLYSTAFNQDLTGWCVNLIPSRPLDFSTGTAMTLAQEPIWGTCP